MYIYDSSKKNGKKRRGYEGDNVKDSKIIREE